MKAVIIEDEINSQEVLESAIANFVEGIEIIGKEDSVSSGIALINKLKPDLIFLDVELPDGTGFDIIEKLENKDVNVIFITAFEHFAVKAYRYCAIDYLLKPLSIDDLIEAIDKAKEKKINRAEQLSLLSDKLNKDKEDENLLIDSIQKYIKVSLKDIVAFKADSSFTYIILENGEKIFSSRSLKFYEDFLDNEQFVRIHRSHIINIKKIVSIDKGRNGNAYMQGDITFEIATRRKPHLLSLLNKK